VKTIEEVDGIHHLHFRDQPTETGFDLVVGADGCWSHVRSVLTDDKPHYSGISGCQFTISNPKERCPEIYARVESGSLFSFSDSKAIMAQQLGSGLISVSAWDVHPENWITQFDGNSSDIEFMKEICLKEHEDWDPRLLDLVKYADGEK